MHVLVCCLEINAERPDGYDESCFLSIRSETVFSSHSVQAIPLQYLKGLLKLSARTCFKISLSTETDRRESFGLEKEHCGYDWWQERASLRPDARPQTSVGWKSSCGIWPASLSTLLKLTSTSPITSISSLTMHYHTKRHSDSPAIETVSKFHSVVLNSILAAETTSLIVSGSCRPVLTYRRPLCAGLTYSSFPADCHLSMFPIRESVICASVVPGADP